MPRFSFALSNSARVREAGVVTSETFAEALDLVGENVEVSAGDTLEIGVSGFPPARFECVSTLIKGEPLWAPATSPASAGRLAA